MNDYVLDIIKKKLRDGKVYIQITSVSKSGLSRKMKFYIVLNDEIVNITREIKTLYKINNIDEYDKKYSISNSEPLLVKGVGMNMCFAVINSIGKLFNEDFQSYKYLY